MPPTETKTIRQPQLEKAVGLLWWTIVGSGIGIRLGVYLHNSSLRNGRKKLASRSAVSSCTCPGHGLAGFSIEQLSVGRILIQL